MKETARNVYVQPVVKTTCATCGRKKVSVFAMGEYMGGKWRAIRHFCRDCFPSLRIILLEAQASDKRTINIKGRNGRRAVPKWMKL
jgi:hypothetical protein